MYGNNVEFFFQVYNALGVEACTALDVAISMGGCESIVEGFYSTMNRHESKGGIGNSTVANRTTVDWSLTHPIRCPKTMRHITKLYSEGSEVLKLRAHSKGYHRDERNRGKFRLESKVINRLKTCDVKYKMYVEEDL